MGIIAYDNNTPVPAAPAPAPKPKPSGSGVTSAQKKAAANLLEIAKFNAGSTSAQLARTLLGYDKAEQTARSSAGVQLTDNSKQSSADRFSQLKNLQGSARSILDSAGNAMQGSQMGSFSDLLRDRSDMDTAETLNTLRQNQQGVQNSLTGTLGDLADSRRSAIDAAAFGVRGIEADASAQLSGINPKLYKKPSKVDLGSGALAKKHAKVPTVKAKNSGYFLPDALPKPAPTPGTTMQGTSYFDKLMNMYNQRSE